MMRIPELPANIQQPFSLFWFRRDLRLFDNRGLHEALKQQGAVLPIFIFDSDILDTLDAPTDSRVNFIHIQLQALKKALEQQGSSLWICYGKPLEVYQTLIARYPIQAVYTNHDYEPYARNRDPTIQKLLTSHLINFATFKDQVIFEKDEILKDNGDPYTVFTPYMKRWKENFTDSLADSFAIQPYYANLLQVEPLPLISLSAIGFQSKVYQFPSIELDLARIQQYHHTRDIPSILGTSRLSVHLRFGTISIRQVTRLAITHNDTWLNELIWRNFYMMILWHFPHVVKRAFKPAYDHIAWVNDETHFQAWCEGRTGYPIVDAGMHELNQTGYMHNRLRMITASFLTKHLLIDWRWGEAYFAKKLLDYELASNNGSWQWVAGCGCDAAPYFRIFNPMLQTKKFDPELAYIKRWNPQFQSVLYPKPIVEHEWARKRALAVYQKATQ